MMVAYWSSMDDLRKTSTGVLRKASHALCGVSGGGVHTPADLMWVAVPDELVDAEGFPGWGDDVPVMFGCTENEARYFVKPGGPQLPFPKNIAIALLNFLKPGGIYSRKGVEKSQRCSAARMVCRLRIFSAAQVGHPMNASTG